MLLLHDEMQSAERTQHTIGPHVMVQPDAPFRVSCPVRVERRHDAHSRRIVLYHGGADLPSQASAWLSLRVPLLSEKGHRRA